MSVLYILLFITIILLFGLLYLSYRTNYQMTRKRKKIIVTLMDRLHSYASNEVLSLEDRQIIGLLTNYFLKNQLVSYQSTYVEIDLMANLSLEIYDLLMAYEKTKRLPYLWEKRNRC